MDILSFCLFGFTPLLILISFDEMDRLYSLRFMLLLGTMLSATAGVYLRAAQTWQRAAYLAVGTTLIMIVNNTATNFYWMKNGWVDVTMSIIQGTLAALIISAPALFELLRQLKGRRQPEST